MPLRSRWWFQVVTPADDLFGRMGDRWWELDETVLLICGKPMFLPQVNKTPILQFVWFVQSLGFKFTSKYSSKYWKSLGSKFLKNPLLWCRVHRSQVGFWKTFSQQLSAVISGGVVEPLGWCRYSYNEGILTPYVGISPLELPGLVNKQFAIEHGHRNSWFSHWTWWFSIAMLNCQRVWLSYYNTSPLTWTAAN